MQRIRNYPQDDDEFAYMPDVARELGISFAGRQSFRTVRSFADRYNEETGKTITVTQAHNYFTCVRWDELKSFAEWYRAKRQITAPQNIKNQPIEATEIPKFTKAVKLRVFRASMSFGEKMVEMGLPEAAFLYFEQPNGRRFSTGVLGDDDED